MGYFSGAPCIQRDTQLSTGRRMLRTWRIVANTAFDILIERVLTHILSLSQNAQSKAVSF